MMTSSPVLAHFPDPIVYQFTLYYPGNMPLIVTAGHGGWEAPDSPVKRRMTHRFTPVDPASPISVPAFSTPVEDSTPDKPEAMLWMPERDQTKGGNFKMDVNTHSTALNLAGAVACIVNEGQNGHQLNSSVPPKCDFADSDDPDTPPPKMPSLQDTLTQGQKSSPFYYPHVVVFRVQRRFVDVNRNISGENAIADHPVAEAAWNEYHVLIEHVQRLAAQRHPYNELRGPSKNSLGLLLDIHGHGHATNLIEVGYLLNGTTLALDDKHLDTHANVLTNLTSIRSLENLIRQNPNPANREDHENDDHGHNDSDNDSDNDMITFSDLLRGQKNSLGGLLQSQGLDSLPSPRYQAPSCGVVYFYGGYTTQRHGSRDKPEDAMDAIQLEMPRTLRFVDKDEGREIGMRMGRAVVEFMTRYYQLPLSMNRVTMPEKESMLGGLNRDTKAAWSTKEQKPIRSGAWESGDSDDKGVVDPKKAKALIAKRQTSRL
ncbi:hypothetical protein BG006_006025 [Podila minutissima]|uniref:Uncharacterized protein n=1 Tax=Podila minutissima TaxID=64525 RepID=A0A9P5SVD8_9FUNG|nr:hypothetical protein BG006_006025 [Podila minutissima]